MRTPAQQAASRANGARSRGPVTPEGKRRASRNALSHGLLARAVVLHNESRAGFDRMLRDYVRRLAPRDALEQCAVEEMCAAAWRIRRLWSIERKVLDLEIAAQDSADQLERIVNAFDSLARNRPHLLLLHRYETRLHNIVRRSLARILALRKSGVPDEPGQLVEITGGRCAPPNPPKTRPNPPKTRENSAPDPPEAA
jgi:hypothetical protein